MSTKKDKDTDKGTTTKASGMDFSPEALLALMQRQQFRQPDKWQPSVVNFQPSGVPTVQTQLAGTQYYDTTPTQFIAPGYEHLRELSVKKALEGEQQKSKFDSVYNTAMSFDAGNNPTYKTAMENIRQSMVKYKDQLSKGGWSENSGMVDDFVHEVSNKRGLKHLMQVQADEAAWQEEVKELSKEHDPKTGTGGIAGYKLDFYNKAGRKTDAVFSEDGTMIGVPKYIPPTVLTDRNIPMEAKNYVDGIMANSQVVPYTDPVTGRTTTMYRVMGSQYGLTQGEVVSGERIAEAVNSYLYNTGGKEYLQREAEIAAYNTAGNYNPENLREVIKTMQKLEAGEDGTGEGLYTKMGDTAAISDDDLLAMAPKIVRDAEYQNRLGALIGGAIALDEYKKYTTTIHENTEEADYRAQKIAQENKAYEASLTGNEVELEPGAYSFGSIGYLEELDGTEAGVINNEILNTEKTIRDLTVAINNYDPSKDDSGEGLAKLNRDRTIAEESLEGLKRQTEIVSKPVIDVIGSSNMGMLYTQYLEGHGLSTADLPFSKFKAAITEATYAEANGKGRAEDILKSRGIKSKIDYTKVKTKKNNLGVLTGYSMDMPASVRNIEGRAVIDNNASTFKNTANNTGDISKYIKSKVPALLKHMGNPQNSTLIRNGMALFEITDAKAGTTKAEFNATVDAASRNLSPEKLTIAGLQAIKGGKYRAITPLSYLKEKYDDDVVAALDLSKARLVPSKFADGRSTDRGKTTYIYRIPISEGTKEKDTIKTSKKLKNDYASGYVDMLVTLDPDIDAVTKSQFSNTYKKLIEKELQNPSTSGNNRVLLENLAMSYANTSGLESHFKNLNLYGLNGAGEKAPKDKKGRLMSETPEINTGEGIYKVQAHNDVGSVSKFDKYFTLQQKREDGQFATYYKNVETGESALLTEQEARQKGNDWTRHMFDTDSDVKAFLTLSFVKGNMYSNANFNMGGGGQRRANEGFNREAAKVFKNVELLVNGRRERHNTYVPGHQLKYLADSGVKINSVQMPYVHESIYGQVTSTAKQYDLTITGGLRTETNPMTEVNGATNSAHFLGSSIDVAADAKGKAFYNKIKANPEEQKRLGISWIDQHDRGSGNHIHVEFMPTNSIAYRGTTTKPDATNIKLMEAISQKESSGGKVTGFHYLDRNKNSSAYGKYGFTDIWFDRMSKHYELPAETIKKRPDLIDNFAKTEYIRIAKSEIKPIFTPLKRRIQAFMSDFTEQDAVILYHYVGINMMKEIAEGKRSINSIPNPEKGNSETALQYIRKIRKYI